MRVLVTGGAGYVGSVVVDELLKSGHEVTVYDNLSKGHLQAVSPGAEMVLGDLSDEILLAQALRAHGVEAVIHMAASSIVGESVSNPAQCFQNNVVNGLRLLDVMLRAGIRKLVFSSTAAVYAAGRSEPLKETDPLGPNNPYGESKLILENILKWYDVAYGLRYVSLRYFNAAGATETLGEDHRPETHLIPLVLQTALQKRPVVEIFGTDYDTPDGTCIRDYIHVSDLARAHVLALEYLREGPSRVYNLGNGKGFSVRQVIRAARTITGDSIPALISARRPGDPPVLIASSELIRKDLGWQPRIDSLHEIIRSAWHWQRQHPDGYAE